MRSPRRDTAAKMTSLSFSNVPLPIDLPISLLPKSTYAVRILRFISTSFMENTGLSAATSLWLSDMSVISLICPA